MLLIFDLQRTPNQLWACYRHHLLCFKFPTVTPVWTFSRASQVPHPPDFGITSEGQLGLYFERIDAVKRGTCPEGLLGRLPSLFALATPSSLNRWRTRLLC